MERSNFGMVLAKIEAVYGTDPVPTAAANLIAVRRNGLNFSPKFNHLLREILDGTLSKTSGLNVPQEVDFTLEVEVRGNRTDGAAADISAGALANAVEIDPLLRACDLAPEYTAESSGGERDGYVDYNPIVPSDGGESCTIYFYTGSKLHKITGCKGNLRGSLVAGQFGILTFELKGIYNAAADAAIPADPAWLNTKPPIVQDLGQVVTGVSLVLAKLDFNLGNVISRRDSVSGTNGVAGFLITGKDPSISIDPETVTEATHPIWGDIQDATPRAFAPNVGTDTGNIVSLRGTGVSRAVGYGDRSGIRTNSIEYSLERSSLSSEPNEEFTLRFA